MLNQLTKLLFSSLSTQDTQTTVYNFNKGTNISVTGNTKKAYNASILLKYYFASISCFISKPLLTISPGKVVIHLCYYNPLDSGPEGCNSITTKAILPNASLILADSDTVPSFQTISHMLNQIFNKPVELELIPLRYPYHDSTILAQVLAVNSNKYNFNRMMQKLFQKATIITKTYSSLSPANNISSSETKLISPISQLTGIKVTIAGRLITQRIVPKSTVKTAYKGQLSSTLGGTASRLSHKFIDSATFTSKNKIGAYTVRVQLGHKVSN